MISFAKLRNDAYGVRSLICDTEAEIVKLPRNGSIGSKAYIIDTGNTYILNGSRQWVLMKNTGNGDGINYDEIIYDGGTVGGINYDEIIYEGGKI